MKPSGIVTLMTDFGLRDPYVGMMKGAILSVHGTARIVDISHHIAAGVIGQAAHILQQTYPYFPKGTVHVTVVDPGVGTERRPILLVTRMHLFVGPDNGLFWPIIEACKDAEVIHLTESRYFLRRVSETFHGRDIFAPVAGHLCQGADPLDMGPVIHDPVQLKLPEPYRKAGSLYGQIVRVDHFGNLITNIRRRDIEGFTAGGRPVVRIGDLLIEGIQTTYAGTPEREALALFDSSGHLEIAVNSGRAVDRTGLDPALTIGREVMVSRARDDGRQP